MVILEGPRTGGPKDYWTLGIVATYANFHRMILGLVDPRTRSPYDW